MCGTLGKLRDRLLGAVQPCCEQLVRIDDGLAEEEFGAGLQNRIIRQRRKRRKCAAVQLAGIDIQGMHVRSFAVGAHARHVGALVQVAKLAIQQIEFFARKETVQHNNPVGFYAIGDCLRVPVA